MLAFEYGAVDRSDVTLTWRCEEQYLLVLLNNRLLTRGFLKHITLDANEINHAGGIQIRYKVWHHGSDMVCFDLPLR